MAERISRWISFILLAGFCASIDGSVCVCPLSYLSPAFKTKEISLPVTEWLEQDACYSAIEENEWMLLETKNLFTPRDAVQVVDDQVCFGKGDRLTRQSNKVSELLYMFTSWTQWSACGGDCWDAGVSTRTRTCFNLVKPSEVVSAALCAGEMFESTPCYLNCTAFPYGAWAEWSYCPKPCNGTTSRSRLCRLGDSECNAEWLTESQPCNDKLCEVDGGWTHWGEWSPCSIHNDTSGIRVRYRACTNPVPKNNGNGCVGLIYDTDTCESYKRDELSSWEEWGEWSKCFGAQDCVQTGTAFRMRVCRNNGTCPGLDYNSTPCIKPGCDSDVQYGEWSEWSSCSHSCGAAGVKIRLRNCTASLTSTGDPCHSSKTSELALCMVQTCTDAPYTEWSVWSSCTHSCGSSGVKYRTRNCTHPSDPTSCDKTKTSELAICPLQDCQAPTTPPSGGSWTQWGNWSECYGDCGLGGTQYRVRNCLTTCTGEDYENQHCVIEKCSAYAQYTEWSEWGACSRTCGPGVKVRSRNCTQGPTCDQQMLSELAVCTLQLCSVDGGWGSWQAWSICNCNQARTRQRLCDNPAPVSNGLMCSGIYKDTEFCVPDASSSCPVDGNWSIWSVWSQCSVTCGNGTRDRNRKCNNPAPAFGGRPCAGQASSTSLCTNIHCPVDGNWSIWSVWSQCSVTCGNGTRDRNRICNNPAPAFGGRPCAGQASSTSLCTHIHCPVDGNWSIWSVWSQCSATCGNGTRDRNRICNNPAPAFGGRPCAGQASSTSLCTNIHCPVDGNWSVWSVWSQCNATCGTGTRYKNRICKSPQPAFGGKPCVGQASSTSLCTSIPCPVDGNWGSWSDWGSCSVTCGDGVQERNRTCGSPAPAHNGADCSGDSTAQQNCGGNPCPTWSQWFYQECSKSCGNGTTIRARLCSSGHSEDCTGSSQEHVPCNTFQCPVDGGWSSWSEYSVCSVTCDTGNSTRTRNCNSPSPEHGGKQCNGDSFDIITCTEKHCPVDGGWSNWSEFSGCSVTCGTGNTTRTRQCDSPVPRYSGANCSGRSAEAAQCNKSPCPVNGGWSHWTGFSTCSVTCGSGNSTRTRTCDTPTPLYGGTECQGNKVDVVQCFEKNCPEWSSWVTTGCSVSCGNGTQMRVRHCSTGHAEDCNGPDRDYTECHKHPCIANGQWSAWSDWSNCDVTCADGHRHRQRTCTNPPPSNGGKDCHGINNETDTCSLGTCPTWSEWYGGMCSVACGGGTTDRLRFCSSGHDEDCPGSPFSTIPCNTQSC